MGRKSFRPLWSSRQRGRDPVTNRERLQSPQSTGSNVVPTQHDWTATLGWRRQTVAFLVRNWGELDTSCLIGLAVLQAVGRAAVEFISKPQQ